MHRPTAEARPSIYYDYKVHPPWLPSAHAAQARRKVVIAGSGAGKIKVFSAEGVLITSKVLKRYNDDDAPLYIRSLRCGDFNGDGVVDIKDYIVWRAGNGPETEYADWTETYGTVYGSGSGAGAGSAVPEPASIAMLLLSLIAASSARRSARR